MTSDMVRVMLHQFVTLLKDGKQVKMSTRKATFITVDELLEEVGPDVLRFFFLMRKSDSQLEFDLDLAKKQSQENPVYYVQYAHARLCSIERQARENGIAAAVAGVGPRLICWPNRRSAPCSRSLPTIRPWLPVRQLIWPRTVIIFYLMNLAGLFHSYYNKHKVISDDASLDGGPALFLPGAENGLCATGSEPCRSECAGDHVDEGCVQPWQRRKRNAQPKKTFRFQLTLAGIVGIGVVCFCLFMWMFLLGIWAGQTILLPAARPAAAGNNPDKSSVCRRRPDPVETLVSGAKKKPAAPIRKDNATVSRLCQGGSSVLP